MWADHEEARVAGASYRRSIANGVSAIGEGGLTGLDAICSFYQRSRVSGTPSV